MIEVVICEIPVKCFIEKGSQIAELTDRISAGQALNRQLAEIHVQILGQRFSRKKRATMCK
jgi:hypothetical protein